jgi:hypothetical protein
MAINKEWHQANRMPKNATLEQRVEWHKAHAANCDCRRDMPRSVVEELRRREAR